MLSKLKVKGAFLAMAMYAIMFSGCKSGDTSNTVDYSRYFNGNPIGMSQFGTPVIPDNRLELSQLGGIGDGVFLNTEVFSAAIGRLSESGGGKLVVPKGIWLTGPVKLESNINLHLEQGAVILFKPDFDLYPYVTTNFEGSKGVRCTSPISAANAENIAITGSGVIDGSGSSWRYVKRGKMTDGQWKELQKSGVLNESKSEWHPNEGSLKGSLLRSAADYAALSENDWNDIKSWLRPVMVSLVNCRNVMLQGVTFQNSPSWNIHPLMCENVIVDGINVRNPWYAQNGDGLDLESCNNVLVVNSSFDVGDDAICIKSGKDAEGRRRGIPCKNVIVDNCKVFHGHGGFVVGSEMSGGASNIWVKNCQFLGTDLGLRFKSTRGRGGVVENIHIENVSMIDIRHEPLLFDLYYMVKGATQNGPVSVTEETPVFRDIYINNVTCNGANRAMFFNGLPEMPIQNIVVSNTSITSANGAVLSQVDGVSFTNVSIQAADGNPLVLNNAAGVVVDGKVVE